MDISIIMDNVKLNFRVGAILKYDNKVLFEKNDNVSFFVIPGGRVKLLEDTKQALDRELKEELGIDFSNVNNKFISVIENFFEFNNVKHHEMYFIYEYKLDSDYKIKDGICSLDSDDSKYYWKTKEEIPNLEVLPNELKEVAYLEDFKRYVVKGK